MQCLHVTEIDRAGDAQPGRQNNFLLFGNYFTSDMMESEAVMVAVRSLVFPVSLEGLFSACTLCRSAVSAFKQREKSNLSRLTK